jgi:hypothetical protein
MIKTSSTQIEVTVTSINQALECVNGVKINKQRGGMAMFSVYFRDGEPVKVDGRGRPHPKLVLAAASAAWRN